MSKNYFKLFAGFTIVIYVGVYSLSGELISSIGTSITFAMIVETLYVELLWRYIPIGRPPILHKKYIAYHRSSHNGGYAYSSTIHIKQTWLSVSTCEKLSDGIYFSDAVSFKPAQFGKFWRLVITYAAQTDYRAPNQSANDPHYGTIIITLDKNDTSCLSGRYFTGRHTPTSGSSLWIALEDDGSVRCPKCQKHVKHGDLKIFDDGSVSCGDCASVSSTEKMIDRAVE